MLVDHGETSERRGQRRNQPGHPVSKARVMGCSMRYCCVVILLASTFGSTDVVVTAQRQRPGPAQPQEVIPREFAFLFHSPEQHEQEVAKRPSYLAYEDELWKGLPYDSISLERGSTGGCVGACPITTVTLYRATFSGVHTAGGELRGRAERRIVEGVADALQTRATRISEGSFRIYDFANLSYLLHELGFVDLPNEYACRSCPADRAFATLTVVAGGTAKAVTDFNLERPVELWAIQQALDSVSTRIQWTEK